ncbi:hypothetical protein DRE_02753 [Drechslerella stenobrocha 248]|uniref:Myb-like domain-containing protein n=1 Tax=Drechslerella stenobrocha 248 TaxID=1043628 RepID=W7HUH5_9PEZI|nr:hypothetical protein DRE_02753 [Drechslerella stenobrocha 248]
MSTKDVNRFLTPPLSDNGKNSGKSTGGNSGIKDEYSDDIVAEKASDGSESVATTAIKTEDAISLPAVEKVTKKRGRPKAADKEGMTKLKKPKAELEGKKQQPIKKKNENDIPVLKRGKAGDFTPEQDAYIRELFASETRYSRTQAHAMFEERYQTGKSTNVIRFRWYALKEEAIVLSTEEEAALSKAIENVEKNKALAVLSEYSRRGESFTKLTQAFVWKRIKDHDNSVGSNIGTEQQNEFIKEE